MQTTQHGKKNDVSAAKSKFVFFFSQIIFISDHFNFIVLIFLFFLKQIFDEWEKILFNKREFRATDKVCERHFPKDEMLTHWDHLIDGQIVQIKRDKPKIKHRAIPTLNMPDMIPKIVAPCVSQWPKKVAPKRPLRKCTQPLNSNEVNIFHFIEIAFNLLFFYVSQAASKKNKKQNTNDIVENDLVEQHKVTVAAKEDNVDVDGIVDDAEVDNPLIDADAKTQEAETELMEMRKNCFETVYDDIYEVVLPSTLWGIHRDPEHKFIAFSMFDVSKMGNTKLLYVTDTFEIRVHMNGLLVSKESLKELSVEFLTNILNDLE